MNGENNTPSVLGIDHLDDAIFNEVFGEAAKLIDRLVTQEHLIEADSTQRVSVPVLDFSLPIPPWRYLQTITKSKLKIEQKSLLKELFFTYGKPNEWLGAEKIHHLMNWSPFSSELAKVILEEHIGNKEELNAFLVEHQQENIIDSNGTTWKPEGLRILEESKGDDDEDDDYLLCGTFKDVEKKNLVPDYPKLSPTLCKRLSFLV